MHPSRRVPALLSLVVVASTCVALAPVPGSAKTTGDIEPPVPAPEGAAVLLAWEEHASAAAYPAYPAPLAASIPRGVPVLGFTSLTMYDAVRASQRRRVSSETAAVGTAAHDVLVHYAPLLHDNPDAPDVAGQVVTTLDRQLKETLLGAPDGAAEETGRRIGAHAAAEFIAGRRGDHFRDKSIHYSKPKLPGFWQPTPPRTDMLEPWLGSLDTVVLHRLVRADGPDRLTGYDYARDYNEGKRYGDAIAPRRSAQETETAHFFNSNSATTVGTALIRYLKAHPMDLRATARVFGVMHAAMTDAVISCWRLKRDVGFWRPREAIAGAAHDGNPATTPQTGWTSLIQPEPPYSDYVSGHGCLTSPATEAIRLTLGEATPLHLVSTNPNALVKERGYDYLNDIETDALNSRIWGGLHFRDAMEDAYDIGRETARRVMREVR